MTTNNDASGHRQRIKEKFLKDNGATMADYELLEVFLTFSIPRKDVKPIAKALLKKFNSLAKILSASLKELTDVDGVGTSVATSIKNIEAIYKRMSWQKISDNNTNIITNWYDLIDYCMQTMVNSKIELFKIIYLNSKGVITNEETLQTGTLDAVYIYPREVLNKVLENKAKGVVLVHNHPSGDPSPSEPDIKMTKQIIEVLSTIDVAVWDHIILAEGEYYSFKESGLLSQISKTLNL